MPIINLPPKRKLSYLLITVRNQCIQDNTQWSTPKSFTLAIRLHAKTKNHCSGYFPMVYINASQPFRRHFEKVIQANFSSRYQCNIS